MALTSFLILPVLTNYLSPEDYGVLSVFNAMISFFSVFITLGMGQMLLVEIVKKRHRFPSTYRSFFVISAAATLVSVLVVVISSFFSGNLFGVPFSYFLFLPVIAFMVASVDIFLGILIYLEKMMVNVVYTLSKYIIEISATLFLVIVAGLNWRGRILGLVISLVIINICIAFFLQKHKLVSLKKTTKAAQKNLLFKSIPLIFMNLGIMIIDLSNRFFISHYSGMKETGLYSIAITICSVMMLVLNVFLNVFRPQMFKSIKEENKSYLKKVILLFHLLLFAVALVIYMLQPLFFHYLINEKFIEAERYILPVLTGYFFWGSYNVFLSFLLYESRNKMVGIISFCSIILNLAFNFILIPDLGAIGAAYSNMITYFSLLVAVILYLYVHKRAKQHEN